MTLTVEDKLELHELIRRYAHIVDNAEWERLGEIFTEDTVFELRGMEGGMKDGLEGFTMKPLSGLKEALAGEENHPLAHLMPNIFIDEIDSIVQIYSRGIFIQRNASESEYGHRVIFGSYEGMFPLPPMNDD